MKAILTIAALLAAQNLYAQGSTTKASAKSAAKAPAAGTTTATATEAAPEATKKFGVNLIAEIAKQIKMLDDGKEVESPYVTAGAAGLTYKATSKVTLEARHNFAYTSERTYAGNVIPGQFYGDNYEAMDFMLRAKVATDATLFGSSKINPDFRAYLPTSRRTRDAKQNVYLRNDLAPEWTINPKLTYSTLLSTRLYLNSGSSKIGSDSLLRLVVTPVGLSYAFNDKLSAYYTYTMDLRSVNYQRGILSAEAANAATHETGMNISVGALTINPAITSDVNQGDGSASVLTADSRVYSADTSSYNLNLYASF
jgi:hypothetical protein